MAKNPWKPWHEVVELREDLKSGELPMHMFAADLYEVLMQSGKRPIYEDPEKFFALTFPTYNLRGLVRDVVLRVAGKNDKAVRQLELTYGGGKTHTLITLLHLVQDPKNLPDLPAVKEFEEAVGQAPPQARVVGLCFDKLDVEKGMEVRAPDGKTRMLKQPWSVLAWQLAGESGLKLLHADNKAEERQSAPAENLLTELLELPLKEDLGVLILIDEVLMYVREKVAIDSKWKDRIVDFFQYLTQAATKVDRCCIVASLLASDPAKSDSFGRQLQGQLYDIFQRQREEAVEPVVKEDVAEVLRRRFFTPKSLKERESFRPHVQAALKGISTIDDQTAKQGAAAEERFFKSYPFHPDLTEVFYTKWTQLDRFQKTRGVLRTFALALREAVQWDQGPIIDPGVFLTPPDHDGLSEALRELVTVADTEEHEGRKQAWTAIISGELSRAQQIQLDSVGLHFREIEKAIIGTFLHSQPIGHSAPTRDLMVLLGATRPDKIELEKGLTRWAQTSFWLDDQYTTAEENDLPETWRLGNRPNLTQMHSVAAGHIKGDVVNARLLEEIRRTKSLTAQASVAGVRVHTLPARPNDIEDDGQFHYAIMNPNAACESGKPSTEATRFIEETTGKNKPRVCRNAVILLAPSKDGLELAMARVRDYLAWEQVRGDLQNQQKEGKLDAARMATLSMNIDKAKGRIPDAIQQAYSIVVTVADSGQVQAFKISISDDPHFTTIKNDRRARIQDTAITAEALLPNGPYNLWRKGETSRRVKDLSGAFAQFPHLPKMLQAKAILDTLVDGCEQGTFVLRLARPDKTFRTWWRSRPDDAALADPALELVLPEAAELGAVQQELLAPGQLPDLWNGEQIKVQDILDYFSGSNVVQVDRGGYQEPMPIPKASKEVLEAAVETAVEAGTIWLLSGPASILAEPIPAGVLTQNAKLREPPPPIAAAEILPENLPDAWTDDAATALSIATALSQKFGQTLPWQTVKDVVTSAINARFVQLTKTSGDWPCEFPAANGISLKVTGRTYDDEDESQASSIHSPNVRAAHATLEPSQLQDLADIMQKVLKVRNDTNVPIHFRLTIEIGDGNEAPSEDAVIALNDLLKDINDDLQLR